MRKKSEIEERRGKSIWIVDIIGTVYRIVKRRIIYIITSSFNTGLILVSSNGVTSPPMRTAEALTRPVVGCRISEGIPTVTADFTALLVLPVV